MALSKTKLQSYAQCPRRVWLETYNPELEEPSAEKAMRLGTGNDVGAIARQLYGGGAGHVVSFDRGLRAAIDATRALVAAGGSEPIFEATFDHEGVSVRIDVLDRSAAEPRMIEVKSGTRVKDHYLDDCAIQAWALTAAGLPPRQIVIATIDTTFVYAGDGRYEGLLIEHDVTDAVRERLKNVPPLVAGTRSTLADIDEPAIAVGKQCRTPHTCDFYEHCAPTPAASPLRGAPKVGAELRDFVRALPYPRFYLDFETISHAVPAFAGTRPYEALPFQWSCHIETAPKGERHAEFLDTSGAPPMRAFAESLLTTLGATGPIVVYTDYERRMLASLANRYPDLAVQLNAAIARLVDLHPPTKQHYDHAALNGSWSLKAVLPTVAPDLDYAKLGEVRDGLAAQRAYVEASAPNTAAPRRDALRRALLDYCRQDTLALVRLVEFFSRPA
ncbi:MAG: DUF2779 domain-containing protein [Gammaproteobacteria bacterium]